MRPSSWTRLIWRIQATALQCVQSGMRVAWIRQVLFGLTVPVGWAIYRCVPWRRRYALEQYSRVTGEPLSSQRVRKLARRRFTNFLRTQLETSGADRLTEEPVEHVVTVLGREHLDRALGAGTGAVVVSAHLGNWELGALAVSRTGYPISLVAGQAANPLIEARFQAWRERYKVEAIPPDDRVGWRILRAIRANRLVVFMGDMTEHEEGIALPFFGVPTHIPRSPVLFAARTGAPILLGYCHREPDGHLIVTFHPPVPLVRDASGHVDETASLLVLITHIEQAIRAHPDQWLWMPPAPS